MSRLFYHATLNGNLSSISKHGLLPKCGAFARAAHGQLCPLHPDPARIHVADRHLDEGLLNALCFHVIRRIQHHVGFDDTYLVEHLEPGWLLAKDLAAFGAIVEVEVPDQEVHFQERRDDACTCLENRDLYLIRPTRIKQFWTYGFLFKELNKASVVDQYRTWLQLDCSTQRRMNDGIYFFEFRPDELATPCPNAEALLAPLRSQYPHAVTDPLIPESA